MLPKNIQLHLRQAFIGGILMFTSGFILPATAQSRFSMSVDVAPIYVRSTFLNDISSTQIKINSRGVRTGVQVHFQIAPRWSASSGLWLEWVHPTTDTRANKDARHTMKVPLLVHYQITDKRLAPFISVGTMLDKPIYYLQTFDAATYPANLTIFDIKIRPVLVFLVGAGAQYRLNDLLSLRLESTINSSPKNYLNKGYQVGLNTQVVFRF